LERGYLEYEDFLSKRKNILNSLEQGPSFHSLSQIIQSVVTIRKKHTLSSLEVSNSFNQAIHVLSHNLKEVPEELRGLQIELGRIPHLWQVLYEFEEFVKKTHPNVYQYSKYLP